MVRGLTLDDIEKDAKRFVNSLRGNKQMDLVEHVVEALNKQYKKVFNVDLSAGVATSFAMTAISAIKYYQAVNTPNDAEFKLIRAFGHSAAELGKILAEHYKKEINKMIRLKKIICF